MVTQKHPMETYHGIVRTPADAIKLFEACRLGLLPRVQRRLSEKERQAIRSGSVFVWDEREAGMRRWTDGKSWSASRVSGSFLTYREMEGKRGGGFGTLRRVSGKTPDSSGRGSDEDQDDGEPDGYRYKADGLMKQSFSITTSSGQHLHLISYYARPVPGEPDLLQPTVDPSLRSVIPVKGMYPESSLSDNTPVAAIGPRGMAQHHHHHHPPPPVQYGHHHGPQQQPPHHHQYPQAPSSQTGYSWPPSPVATPPYNHHYTTSSVPYPSQPTQLQQPQHHYARTPPLPPTSLPSHGYYAYQQPPPLAHHSGTSVPYGSAAGEPPAAPSSQYDRMPLPPLQHQPGAHHAPPHARSSPPSHAPFSRSQAKGTLSDSPRAVYRNLPPVTTSLYQGGSSSAPGSAREGHFPGLSTSVAASPTSSVMAGSGGDSGQRSALTPPYQQQQKGGPGYGACGDTAPYMVANSVSPTAGSGSSNSKTSNLSALLHPTPTSSEPDSTHAGSTNSANSSPRRLAAPPALGLGGGIGSSNGIGPSALPQHFLQPAPSGEDSRALSRLDKKFRI